MVTSPSEIEFIEIRVTQLFALVSEALAGATEALLSNDAETGLAVVDGDQSVDDLTAEVELLVWRQLENEDTPTSTLRHLVGVLLILPELERSGDLAEHIAQRAVTHLGAQMSPLSRGIVQRMAEVALEMWRDAADAYGDRSARCRRPGRRRRRDRHPARPLDGRDRRRVDADSHQRPGHAAWPASTNAWGTTRSIWLVGSRCCTVRQPETRGPRREPAAGPGRGADRSASRHGPGRVL